METSGAPSLPSIPSGNDVVFRELDYAKYSTSHGTYQLTQIIQQTGGQTINGGLTVNGGQETIFELSPKVYNFAQSIIRYQITPVAEGNAGYYNFVFNDCVPELRQVQLYTRNGLYLCDVQDMNNYTNLILRSTTKLTDLLDNDQVANGAGGTNVWEGLQTCDNTITNAAGGQLITAPYIPPLSTVAVDKITTPNYYIQGTANANTPVYTRQFPLSIFKNTILAMDKDLYFGGETLYLRFVWAPLTKIMYIGSSLTNLSTGAANAVTGAAVSNLIFFGAVEQNPVIQENLKNKINPGSFNILVPYVFETKLNLQGTTQTVNVRYNRAHGQRLHKIYVAPYNATETNQTAYDHSNITAAGVPGTKVSSFYTTINEVRTTQFNPTAANYDEWMLLGKKLKGSCIQSSTDYYTNYFWMEDFTNNTAVGEKPISPPEDNMSDGISLDQELKFSMFAFTANNTYNWYVFGITERILTIGPGVITLN